MKQDYRTLYVDSYPNLDEKSIYHVAGHATAIYLGNKQKQLPSVHFNILIMRSETQYNSKSGQLIESYDRNSAKIVGGQLIQSLPMAHVEVTNSLAWFHQAKYRRAFEADVSNLLVGPLAEAKYVAIRDGEVFNANLINLSALANYGGTENIELVNEYMECFMLDEAERMQKLA